jgi:nucleoside-diphosphate-sugar epimerase
MSAQPRVAAVTGANGFVGGIVTEALTRAGFRARRLVRRPGGRDDVRYSLVEGCTPSALTGVDVLVHCAYDLKETSRRRVWATNVFGTRRLLDAAAAAGVRRSILVSSMSAYAGTRQLYGRAKLASELDAFRHGMCAVRLGLVYGSNSGGMVGALRRLTSLPVVPVVGSHSYQFTLHEEDLAHAVVVLANAEHVPSRPLGLAHPTPVPFEQVLRSLADAGGRRPPVLVPVPWTPLYAAMRGLETLHVPLPLRSDSLLGLVRPAPSVPGADDVRSLGARFRPFPRAEDTAPPPS